MAGYQPEIFAATYITMAAALLALSLRFKARAMTQVKLWYDDYFALIAFAFAVGYCTVVTVCTVHYGLGIDVDTSDPDNEYILEKSRLTLWTGSLTYASSIASSKISFLSFYWRLFQFTSIRIPIQILVVTTAIWYVARTCVTVLQCLPVAYIWNKNIDGYCGVDQSKFFFGSVLVHCLLDIIILVLPIFPISSMHLSSSKKLGVVALFSSGAIVCIASVFVLIESINYHPRTNQQPAGMARNWYWASVEVNMAVFSASLPMLRTIMMKLFPGCLTSNNEESMGGGYEGFRLSHVSQFRRSDHTSSSRNFAKPKSDRPSSGDMAPGADGSGSTPSGSSGRGAARVTTDFDYYGDFADDDDDDYDASDPWHQQPRSDCDVEAAIVAPPAAAAGRKGDMRIGRGDGMVPD